MADSWRHGDRFRAGGKDLKLKGANGEPDQLFGGAAASKTSRNRRSTEEAKRRTDAKKRAQALVNLWKESKNEDVTQGESASGGGSDILECLAWLCENKPHIPRATLDGIAEAALTIAEATMAKITSELDSAGSSRRWLVVRDAVDLTASWAEAAVHRRRGDRGTVSRAIIRGRRVARRIGRAVQTSIADAEGLEGVILRLKMAVGIGWSRRQEKEESDVWAATCASLESGATARSLARTTEARRTHDLLESLGRYVSAMDPPTVKRVLAACVSIWRRANLRNNIRADSKEGTRGVSTLNAPLLPPVLAPCPSLHQAMLRLFQQAALYITSSSARERDALHDWMVNLCEKEAQHHNHRFEPAQGKMSRLGAYVPLYACIGVTLAAGRAPESVRRMLRSLTPDAGLGPFSPLDQSDRARKARLASLAWIELENSRARTEDSAGTASIIELIAGACDLSPVLLPSLGGTNALPRSAIAAWEQSDAFGALSIAARALVGPEAAKKAARSRPTASGGTPNVAERRVDALLCGLWKIAQKADELNRWCQGGRSDCDPAIGVAELGLRAWNVPARGVVGRSPVRGEKDAHNAAQSLSATVHGGLFMIVALVLNALVNSAWEVISKPSRRALAIDVLSSVEFCRVALPGYRSLLESLLGSTGPERTSTELTRLFLSRHFRSRLENQLELGAVLEQKSTQRRHRAREASSRNMAREFFLMMLMSQWVAHMTRKEQYFKGLGLALCWLDADNSAVSSRAHALFQASIAQLVSGARGNGGALPEAGRTFSKAAQQLMPYYLQRAVRARAPAAQVGGAFLCLFRGFGGVQGNGISGQNMRADGLALVGYGLQLLARRLQHAYVGAHAKIAKLPPGTDSRVDEDVDEDRLEQPLEWVQKQVQQVKESTSAAVAVYFDVLQLLPWPWADAALGFFEPVVFFRKGARPELPAADGRSSSARDFEKAAALQLVSSVQRQIAAGFDLNHKQAVLGWIQSMQKRVDALGAEEKVAESKL